MLGHEIAAALPELRAHAESLMVDTVTIRRVLTVETDPDTGGDVVTYDPTPIYSGKCRVGKARSADNADESAGSTITESSRILHIPDSAPEVLPGDVAVMAADTYTPRLRGVTYRATDAHEQSDATAQRVPIERLSGVSNG